jgi:hypothetical protein
MGHRRKVCGEDGRERLQNYELISKGLQAIKAKMNTERRENKIDIIFLGIIERSFIEM